jgi:hypothetical protein
VLRGYGGYRKSISYGRARDEQKVGKSIMTARNLVDLTVAISGRVMGGMLMYTK